MKNNLEKIPYPYNCFKKRTLIADGLFTFTVNQMHKTISGNTFIGKTLLFLHINTKSRRVPGFVSFNGNN